MDHYEALEVERGASAEDIKSAWRSAQTRWHPDRNPDSSSAEEHFKQASEAYEVLSDPDKRRIYDLGVSVGPDGRFDPNMFDPSRLNKDDLIRSFVRVFGVYLDDKIPGFRDAARNAAHNVEKAQAEKNAQKKARRKRWANGSHKCSVCKGKKRITMQQGNFQISVACKRCEPSN
jgi:molecular chaperone DnaJ